MYPVKSGIGCVISGREEYVNKHGKDIMMNILSVIQDMHTVGVENTNRWKKRRGVQDGGTVTR